MTRQLATIILCLAVSSVLAAGSLETDFKQPPMQFKSQPLWHMNGTLETDEIKRQLQDARHKSGFSGVAVLPVNHTRPDYLSEDYFARYGDILETCKSLGMKVIFYDDIGFPSGTAGGQLKKLYPALWHDIGPDTAAARVAMFGFRAELLSEGFPRKVQQWAAAHAVQSSGHAMGQYHPQPTFLGADHIKFYEHSDIPMIDSIHYYGHGRPGFRLTSSAACSYDRPLTTVEIYGNFRETFDAHMLYRNGMELFARGANVFLPHGMWYNPKAVRIKPLISDYNADISADLGAYNEWVGRASLLLQGGRPVVDIGVLYPIAAMQAHARLDAVVDRPRVKGNVHPGLYVPPESDLNRLSDCLTGSIRRDFTFLHPEILDERCDIDGPLLWLKNKVNHQAYRVLIMPGCRVIHWSNLKTIKAFYEAGGQVVATTMLPTQSAEFGHDADVQEVIEHIFGMAPDTSLPDKRIVIHGNANGGKACFIPRFKQDPRALADALAVASPVADVAFDPGAPRLTHLPQSGSGPPKEGQHTGMLSYLHKVKAGRHLYFMANSTDAPVDTQVVLRGVTSTCNAGIPMTGPWKTWTPVLSRSVAYAVHKHI